MTSAFYANLLTIPIKEPASQNGELWKRREQHHQNGRDRTIWSKEIGTSEFFGCESGTQKWRWTDGQERNLTSEEMQDQEQKQGSGQ